MRAVHAMSLLVTAACLHDLEELEPSLADAHQWLDDDADDACKSCIVAMCKPEVEACIVNESCHATFAECYPPRPNCGTISPIHYRLGTCVNRYCDSACNFGELRLECIGDSNYIWPDPPEDVNVNFTVRWEPFEGGAERAPLTALVEVCSGQPCQVESSAQIADGSTVELHYRWLPLTRRQPYLRVTGEGIQRALFFEDLPIPEAYFFPVVVQTRQQYLLAHVPLTLAHDPALGTLNALLIGCVASPTPGIRFSLEQNGASIDAGVAYYFDGTTLVKAPAVDQTVDPGLFGGFAHLEPGLYDVLAREAATDTLVGVARSVLVEADTLTHVNIMALASGELQARPSDSELSLRRGAR